MLGPLWLAALLTQTSAFNPRSKRGLSWPNAHWVPIGGFTHPSSQISSYYNWTPLPVPPQPLSYGPEWINPFPFIPMLWGCTAQHIDAFNSALQKRWDGASLTSDKAILAFNEPDLGAQANCSPREAADVWRKLLQPLKAQGYRIGSPAVTNGPEGRKWLNEWWAACEGGCDPDFMTVHWYDIDVGRFMSHIKDFRTAYNRPIWVTEYAPTNFTFSSSGALIGTQPTYEQVRRFMDITNAWMDGIDWIERYFWFGAMYEMVRVVHRLSVYSIRWLIYQQGVTDLATLLIPSGKAARTGALSDLGVQYAGANGTIGSRTVAYPSVSARPRWESGASNSLGPYRVGGVSLLLVSGFIVIILLPELHFIVMQR